MPLFLIPAKKKFLARSSSTVEAMRKWVNSRKSLMTLKRARKAGEFFGFPAFTCRFRMLSSNLELS